MATRSLALSLLASILVFQVSCSFGPLGRSKKLGETYSESMRAYGSGDLKTAEKGLLQITARLPGDSEAWFKLGNIYAQTNRPRQAVGAYREALVRNPDLTKAWYNMGVVLLRQSANSFVSLTRHAPAGDPLQPVAADMADDIMSVLQGIPERNDDDAEAADTASTGEKR